MSKPQEYQIETEAVIKIDMPAAITSLAYVGKLEVTWGECTAECTMVVTAKDGKEFKSLNGISPSLEGEEFVHPVVLCVMDLLRQTKHIWAA